MITALVFAIGVSLFILGGFLLAYIVFSNDNKNNNMTTIKHIHNDFYSVNSKKVDIGTDKVLIDDGEELYWDDLEAGLTDSELKAVIGLKRSIERE